MTPCYNGPNPITDKHRLGIWKWAKENAIDHGLPFEKVQDMINDHFFGGQGRAEWITDILSGRKTPYRQLANEAWKAQYNRRQIVQQAKALTREQAQNPAFRAIGKMWNFPRRFAVAGHGLVFPITHAGELAFRPQSWGVFMRGFLNTWTKSWSPGDTERLLESMKRDDWYQTALRSHLDVGEKAVSTDLISRTKKGGLSERAVSILTAMRFELWKHEMEKYVKDPTEPQERVLDIGKNLAEWANHATGSAKGPLSTKIPGIGGWIFGPKLLESKLARLGADPYHTVDTFTRMLGHTFANWEDATPGEKAVAWTRFKGLGQYLGTGLGFLAVNQGLNMALSGKYNYKDLDEKDKLNFTDPTKGDWLSFKGGGMEWSLPGMHSEFKTLGKILAISFMDSKASNKFSHGQGKQALLGQAFGNYLLGKANPAFGIGKELLTGQDFLGRPLPWTGQKPKKGFPRVDWGDFLISHGPIPLTGPIRYIYDTIRDQGASAMDATGIIKALIMAGVGGTGIEIKPDSAAEKEPAKRAPAGRMTVPQAVKRQRAAEALRNR